MANYQIFQKSSGICVAEYESATPLNQQSIDPLYTDADYETKLDGNSIITPVVLEWEPLDFLRLLTVEERAAIRLQARTDIIVEDGIALLQVTKRVKSDDVDLIRLLNYFKFLGILTDVRINEILGL